MLAVKYESTNVVRLLQQGADNARARPRGPPGGPGPRPRLAFLSPAELILNVFPIETSESLHGKIYGETAQLTKPKR